MPDTAQIKPQPMSHYNTTNETGQTLIDFRAKANNQTEVVYQAMQRLGKASPSQVWKDIGGAFLLTSIRRSLSDLTEEGRLVKTADKVKSMNGGPEHLWKIAA